MGVKMQEKDLHLANNLFGKIKGRNVDFWGLYTCRFNHITQENRWEPRGRKRGPKGQQKEGKNLYE